MLVEQAADALRQHDPARHTGSGLQGAAEKAAGTTTGRRLSGRCVETLLRASAGLTERTRRFTPAATARSTGRCL
ncbi:hypothetical protein D3C81_1777460 [compost metagenome]